MPLHYWEDRGKLLELPLEPLAKKSSAGPSSARRKHHEILAYFHMSFLRTFQTQSHLQTDGFYFPLKINALGLTLQIYCAFLAKPYKMWDVYHGLALPTAFTMGWLRRLWQTKNVVSPAACSWNFILKYWFSSLLGSQVFKLISKFRLNTIWLLVSIISWYPR